MHNGMSSFLGDAGGCPAIELNGKTWKIGHPTQRAKESLERLVIRKASAEILDLKNSLPAEQYGEFFESHKSDVAAGVYRTWGKGWQRIAFDPANFNLFLLSLIQEHHPEATEKDVATLAAHRPDEMQLALMQVVPDFFEMLLEGTNLQESKKQEARFKMLQVLQQFKKPSPGTGAS